MKYKNELTTAKGGVAILSTASLIKNWRKINKRLYKAGLIFITPKLYDVSWQQKEIYEKEADHLYNNLVFCWNLFSRRKPRRAT